MINDTFQQDLQQKYSRTNWRQWLKDIFDTQFCEETHPEEVTLPNGKAKSIERFGSVSLADGKNLAVLDIITGKNIQIARNRVELREIVVQLIDHDRYHGPLVFYPN